MIADEDIVHAVEHTLAVGEQDDGIYLGPDRAANMIEVVAVAREDGSEVVIAAGFANVTATASAWCFASAEERAWWGGLWADRMRSSAVADQVRREGLAADEELRDIAAAWRAWSAEPDGWFAVLHGELVCQS